MLRAIRDGSQSWYVIGLLLLIIASFALWGVTGTGSGTQQPIAIVGDETVTQNSFLRAFQGEVNARQRQDEGADYTFEKAYEEGLDDQILQRLLFGKTFDNAATQLGLYASDEQVAETLLGIPNFVDVAGQFDPVAYKQELDAMNMTTNSFEESLRDEFEADQMMSSFFGAAPVPAALVESIFKRNLQERSVEFFRLANSDVSVDAPSESDIRAEYDDNPDEYTSDEIRRLTYVTLQISDLVRGIQVTEEEIAELYESRMDSYVTPETRTLQYLLVDGEQAAEDLRGRLIGGLTIEEAAGELGQVAAEANLGDVSREDIAYIGEAAVEAAFAAENGSISEVAESDLGGYAVFRVAGVTPKVVSSLDDVREQLRTDVAIEIAQDQLVDLADEAQDMLSEDATIEEVVEKLDLDVRTVNSVSTSGFDQYGNIVQGLPSSRRFIASAFAKQPDDFNDVEETETGGYFIVRVDSVTPPALQDFEDIKSRARQKLVNERRSQAAADRANGLLDQARTGQSLAVVAADAGASVETAEGLKRDGTAVPAGFSRLGLERLFASEQGGITMAPNMTADGYIVARVTTITDNQDEAGGEVLAALERNVGNLMANDLAVLYQQYLDDKNTPEINITVREQLREQLTQ